MNTISSLLKFISIMLKDCLVPLDTTAQSGIDKEIYDSLVALGWTDCIE